MKNFGKVAVLFGGRSAEREVSLKSGNAVLAALQRSGVDAHAFDPAVRELHALRDEGFDRAFVILHGRFGEDGTVQGALELMGIPYTGSGVMASALAMDKWRTKLVWQAAGLPVASYELLTAHSDWNGVVQRLGLPLFVKPANEGSSVGITKVKQAEELRAAYETAAKYDSLVLVEKFIAGRRCSSRFWRERCCRRSGSRRRTSSMTTRPSISPTIPATPALGLSAETEKRLADMELRSFAVLGCSGWGRVDLILDANGKPYLLEINTSPGMTDHSLVPMAARQAGMSFEELVLKILESADLKNGSSRSLPRPLAGED